MLKITAEINRQDIKNLMENFSGALVRKAVRSALDRSGTWGKNYLASDVSDNYNISKSRVKKAITIHRTTASSLEVKIIATSKAQFSMLQDFGAIQDRSGVVVRMGRNKVIRYPHAFINARSGPLTKHLTKPDKWGERRIATSGGKGRFIAIRVGRERYNTSGKPGRGPHLTTLLNRLENREKMNKDLKDHLYQELSDQIARRTGGLPQLPDLE